jgi:hypothetical protein
MAGRTKQRSAAGKLLAAMGHPLRSESLRILRERGNAAGIASPSEISRELDLPKEEIPNISYHVKRLVSLDCAELVETRPVRGATEHFYRATRNTLISLEDWDRLHPAVRDNLVAEDMQAIINDFLASEKAGMIGSDEYFHLTRTPMVLDQEGLEEGLEVFEQARERMIEVQRLSAERRKAGADGFHVSSAIALFEMPPPAGGSSSG